MIDRVVVSLERALHIPSSFIAAGGLWCYRFSSKWVLIGGALTDGGSLLAWYHELCPDSDAAGELRSADRSEKSAP